MNYFIFFVYILFKWKNFVSYNVGVIVIIVGILKNIGIFKELYDENVYGESIVFRILNIILYLVFGKMVFIKFRKILFLGLLEMFFGNFVKDGGYFFFIFFELLFLDNILKEYI